MTSATSPVPSRAMPALWLIASQAVCLLSLVAWALLAGLSFITSSPDGALLPRPLLWVLWVYPVLPLVCAPMAWAAFRRGDLRRARTLTTIPLALAIPLLAYAAYMASPVG